MWKSRFVVVVCRLCGPSSAKDGAWSCATRTSDGPVHEVEPPGRRRAFMPGRAGRGRYLSSGVATSRAVWNGFPAPPLSYGIHSTSLPATSLPATSLAGLIRGGPDRVSHRGQRPLPTRVGRARLRRAADYARGREGRAARGPTLERDMPSRTPVVMPTRRLSGLPAIPNMRHPRRSCLAPRVSSRGRERGHPLRGCPRHDHDVLGKEWQQAACQATTCQGRHARTRGPEPAEPALVANRSLCTRRAPRAHETWRPGPRWSTPRDVASSRDRHAWPTGG